MEFVLPMILAEADGKWQCNVGRAEMITLLAQHCPDQMSISLTAVLPVVADLMWDTKAAVRRRRRPPAPAPPRPSSSLPRRRPPPPLAPSRRSRTRRRRR